MRPADYVFIFWFTFWVALALITAADICVIYQLIQIAKKKGHYPEGAKVLGFIGVILTPLILALIVIALPDWSDRPNAASVPGSSDPNGLPEV